MSRDGRRPPGWALVGLALWIAWLAVGIFPFAPLEGDEQGVISGATALAHGESAYYHLAYLPEIQPGAYILLSHLSRWTRLEVQTWFGIGSAVGVALFVYFSTLLLSRVLALPWWVTLAGLLWCQEVSAGAYYMNTTAVGMWLTFAALWLACRPPTWRTVTVMASLIAVAGWIRIDCLLPTPALPVLMWITTRHWRITLRGTALVAVGSLGLVLVLYASSGVTWEKLSDTYVGRGYIVGWWPTLRAMPLILSPAICFLAALGGVWLFLRREWPRLILVVAGCAVTLQIYGTSLASPKYFFHLVPFFLIAALYAFARLGEFVDRSPRTWRVALLSAGALLVILEQTVSLQTSSAEFRRFVPQPVLATLATLPGPRRPIHLVLGAGEFIPNTDGFRLRGGALFAPWAWHAEKIAINVQLARFADRLGVPLNATVYYSGWLPYQLVVRVLRATGFRYLSTPQLGNTMPYFGRWEREGHHVDIAFLPYRDSLYADANLHPANGSGDDTFFIGDLGGHTAITELADANRRTWQPIWPEYPFGFAVFYQRKENSIPR